MKVLLVEDEPTLAGAIQGYLHQGEVRCEVAPDYATAHEKLHLYHYDCILLDLNLPDGDGLRLLRALRRPDAPLLAPGVIIISARDALDDRVAGLAAGADDYVGKPFHLAELSARLHAVVRRRQFGGQPLVVVGNLHLDLLNRTAQVGATELLLTRKEFDLLRFFLANGARVVSRLALAEHIWGDHADQYDSYDFLYSQIKNLRRKLAEAGASHLVQAVYGVGYRFLPVEDGAPPRPAIT